MTAVAEEPTRGTRSPTGGWDDAAEWYDRLVGDEGSEYHRHVVFPRTLKLLSPRVGQRVLDVACGQGALCRLLHHHGVIATGIDASEKLIKAARRRNASLESAGAHAPPRYFAADARRPVCLEGMRFDAAACILAIQNIDGPAEVFRAVAGLLVAGGRFVMVMMHPCFRSPRYSSWGWDEAAHVQYRRVERYLGLRKEPIFTHPGRRTGQYTWTYHRPLQWYFRALREAGLLVDALEEWPGHKQSTSGPRAAAENVARREIPLFAAIRAVKAAAPASPDSGPPPR